MIESGGNAPEDEDDIEWIIEVKDGITDKQVDDICHDAAVHACLSEGHPDEHGLPVTGVKATILGLTKLLANHTGEVLHVEPNLPIFIPADEAHVDIESKQKSKQREEALLQTFSGPYYVMRHITDDFVVGETYSGMSSAVDRFYAHTKDAGGPVMIADNKFEAVKYHGTHSKSIERDFANWWTAHTGKKVPSAPKPTPAPPAADADEEESEDAPVPAETDDKPKKKVDNDVRRRRVNTKTDYWGLDRIDADQGLDNHYEAPYDGHGVHVYVMDTGIKHDHTDFMAADGKASRAETTLEMWGSTVMECSGPADVTCAADRQGHGTHCAGSVGGEYSGVAKGATIHGVKVLGDDGLGSDLGVAMAIDWIMTKGKRPAVLSMSLGRRGSSTLMADILKKATDSGLVVVVAAGNEGMDACGNSPAFVREAITVAAATEEDTKADFSNYGSCVDIFAPGKSIRSAYYSGAAVFAKLSGTSMACPQVAGFAAMVLQANPKLSSQEVKEIVLNDGIRNKMLSAGPRSPDLMLHVKRNPTWGKSAKSTSGKSGKSGGGSTDPRPPGAKRRRRGKPAGIDNDLPPDANSRRRGKRRRRTPVDSPEGDLPESPTRRRRGKKSRRRRRRKSSSAPAPA
jgi:subtilisin family serine protease